MVDRTITAEALDRFLAREPEIAFDLHDELRVIVAAARAVVEAPEWTVCDAHNSKALPDGLMCEWKYLAINTPWVEDESGPCRMVWKFLVPAEEES
jgi:hypothetical protein